MEHGGGSLRIGERIIPIIGIKIEDGCFVMKGLMHGPAPAERGVLRMFGRDGKPLLDYLPTQCSRQVHELPPVAEDEVFTVEYELDPKCPNCYAPKQSG
jgi:hypothetical protein